MIDGTEPYLTCRDRSIVWAGLWSSVESERVGLESALAHSSSCCSSSCGPRARRVLAKLLSNLMQYCRLLEVAALEGALKSFIVSDLQDRRCWRSDQKANVLSVDHVESWISNNQRGRQWPFLL
jgi:hypothetical protein